MKKRVLYFLTFLFLVPLIAGCQKSWKSMFQVSEIKIDNDYIVAKIKNVESKAYDLKIDLQLKSGSLTETEKCYLTIKPNEIKDLKCLTMGHNGYEAKITNIEFTEKIIPELKDGKIEQEVLEYHFDKIYEQHRLNFISFTLINDITQKDYPYISLIEYDSSDSELTIGGTITDGNYNNVLYIETYNTITNELDRFSFSITTKDEETGLTKCYRVGYKWCVSSTYNKTDGFYDFRITQQ